MLIAALLSVLVGLSLGLLGGGGSVLSVPVLIHAAGVEPRQAIATSLLVVGLTAAAAVVPHARRGRVRWRTALLFGAAGMTGAFAGGHVAQHVAPELLLMGLAALMIATAAAMLRGRTAAPRGELAPVKVLALGAGTGMLTGLFGAGGGFLVVPALVVFGGLEMAEAIGTGLVVVSLQSFAGLAGHLGHTAIDVRLAAAVSVAAVAGSVVGGKLSTRVPQAALRQAFAWLVLAVALFTVSAHLPAGVLASPVWRALFVERWPWWAGGAAIGGFVLLFLWSENQLLGVSTGCAELCRIRSDASVRRSWRPPFLLGIVLGGAVSGVLAGSQPTLAVPAMESALGALAPLRLPLLVAAGTMIGWGARTAGGCTSGHSIVGVAQGARSSMLATVAFMAAGFAATQLLVVIGGPR